MRIGVGVHLLAYAAILAAVVLAVLFGMDRIVKAGGKGAGADLSLNAVFFTGLAITLAFMAVTIAAFSGALSLLPWLLGGGAAVMALAYAWRRAQASASKAWLEEQFAQEEARLRETAERDPANSAAWGRLAELCERKGDYASAMRCLRKICELEPGELSERRLREMKKLADEALLGNRGQG